MNIRTRLALTSAVLLVGTVTSACGSGSDSSDSGAPTDASDADFCSTQTSLFTDLVGDTANPEVPSDDDMATAVKNWAAKLEKVGTPKDIPDEARAGFDALVAQAKDIDADDFSIDKLDELSKGGVDASEDARAEATAFSDYLTETCGNPLDDLDLPQVPESTE